MRTFCRQKFLRLGEKTGIKKFIDKSGRLSRFSVAIFCLTVPDNFLGEPFCVSEKSGHHERFWIKRMGREKVSRFSIEICCLTLLKIFRREGLCFSEIYWYQQLIKTRELKRRGGIKILRRISFHSLSENFFRPTLSFFRFILVSKNGKGRGGRENSSKSVS